MRRKHLRSVCSTTTAEALRSMAAKLVITTAAVITLIWVFKLWVDQTQMLLSTVVQFLVSMHYIALAQETVL